MKIHKLRFLGLFVAILSLAASQAAAVTLTPGPSVITTGAPVPTGGTVLFSGPSLFTSATFSGTLTTSIISGDPSNSYGGLTFTYLLANDVTSSHAIGRFTINDFDGFLVDANYQTPTVGQLPSLFDRSAGAGATIGESFIAPIGGFPGLGLGVLAPGSTSALWVVQTSALYYQPTIASVIDGSVAPVATFAPAVPEPSTLALAGCAAVALMAWRRRRAR